MYIYTHICAYIYIYMNIYRGREREKERERERERETGSASREAGVCETRQRDGRAGSVGLSSTAGPCR